MINEADNLNELEKNILAQAERNVFHEFRIKFTELIEDSISTKLQIAQMSSAISASQEQIYSQLIEMTQALKMQNHFEMEIEKATGKIERAESELIGLRSIADDQEMEISELRTILLNAEKTNKKMTEKSLLIKAVTIGFVLQLLILLYHAL